MRTSTIVALAVLGIGVPTARAQELETNAASTWRPAGTVHFVLQSAATMEALITPGRTPIYGGGELSVGADVRLAPEVHLRALLTGGGQAYDDFRTYTSEGLVETQYGTGFVWGGVRLIVGLVIAPFVAVRFGGDLGFEGVASIGRMTSYGGGLFELALRLTDDERLEIIAQVATQSRAEGTWVRSDPQRDALVTHELAVRGSLGVGWLF